MESLLELYKIGHGPSSSHTMGPIKALNHFIANFNDATSYEVVLFGSLALTGKGHLTDVALHNVFNEKQKKGNVIFNYDLDNLYHPNTLIIKAINKQGFVEHQTTYYSIGGGNLAIDGVNLNEENNVYPFAHFKEIKTYCHNNDCSYVDVVNNFDVPSINEDLLHIWQIMKEVIAKGLTTSGTLPGTLALERKAHDLYNYFAEDESPVDEAKRKLFAYAYAVSEENASGGIVVTAPTCGSAGILPSVLYNAQLTSNYHDEQIVDALKVAGLIGVTVKQNASISGAECGCQAECGVAAAMAAAALAYLANFNLHQIEYASEVALEHHLGLTCDPIGGYVQIPCIERNAVIAGRAYDAVLVAKHLTMNRRISLDDIIQTMYETGLDLNTDYKETSRGGMAKLLKM